MIRTQLYLTKDLHECLLEAARSNNTTMSDLLRQGATLILKKKGEAKISTQQQALHYLINPPEKDLITSDKSAVQLARIERD